MEKSSYKASTVPENLEVVHLICVKEAYFHDNRYIFKPGDITWCRKTIWEDNLRTFSPEHNRHRGNYKKDCFKVLNNLPYKLKTFLL